MSSRHLALFVCVVAIVASACEARIMKLVLENDARRFVEISKFGYLVGGTLDVGLNNFSCSSMEFRSPEERVGLVLSQDETVLEYEKSNAGSCFFDAPRSVLDSARALFLLMDFQKQQLEVRNLSFPSIDLAEISGGVSRFAINGSKPAGASFLDFVGQKGRFQVKFQVVFHEEGYYVLTYHECKQTAFFHYGISSFSGTSFQISVVEKNPSSYLSQGEMPVASIYMVFSAIFFALFCIWAFILLSKKENVYKIHILMAVLVLLKSMSVMLHGLNLHFIGVHGQQLEAWAVMYYILHLIKGSLLFGTIVLIGTGWTLFKNFLVERDRKLLVIVIPIQVLDNFALIVFTETEIGQQRYEWSKRLFIFFDLICCAAVIIPILWSIKHLEQASQTDGKAVFNLQKLRLFQQFYIVIICYIYITRIVKYLIQFTIPFKYMWITTVIEELGTALLFLWTGAKFKPAPNNPYLRLSQSDEEEDSTYALTQSGVLEDVIFLSSKHKSKRGANAEDEVRITLQESLMQ
uniref:Lung seven transmembrane receptor n=1 Tax=Trichuris muris TaxID=70415 RepID=A0A5S6QXR1_TRIMR